MKIALQVLMQFPQRKSVRSQRLGFWAERYFSFQLTQCLAGSQNLILKMQKRLLGLSVANAVIVSASLVPIPTPAPGAPAVAVLPAIFAGFPQFVPPVIGLPAFIPVTLDGFVQSMIGFIQPVPATIGFRRRCSRKKHQTRCQRCCSQQRFPIAQIDVMSHSLPPSLSFGSSLPARLRPGHAAGHTS